MRKITLFWASAAAKSGWVMVQPGASVRPLMTNRSCTPPSGVPSRLRTKRASRTAPVVVMNDGTPFLARSNVAIATCGSVRGFVPPTAGGAWQPEQLFMLNPGPKPLPLRMPGGGSLRLPETESISRNRRRAAEKSCCS